MYIGLYMFPYFVFLIRYDIRVKSINILLLCILYYDNKSDIIVLYFVLLYQIG